MTLTKYNDIVCAKHGKIWYPAQVFTQNEIPEHVLQKLAKNIQGKVFVKGGGMTTFQCSLSQMLNHQRKTKLMNTDQHDPLKCQNRITLPYLKSLLFSTNTLCFHLGTLLHYCTSTALCSLRGNEFVQHFVWKCESLPLS